jgi:4-hydroxy-3-methylbut-2-en-1-yl diphosphate synthase IspG/GcpE
MKGVVFDFAIGRKNWLHLGSQEAGLKIAAIFSIVESYRKLGILIRKYLADTLPVSLIAPSTSWMT